MEEISKAKDIIKVALVGPECTGKSTLSSLLAKYYNTAWVPEYARQYIDRLDRPYEEKDLLKIAKGQTQLEDKFSEQANKVLICDTDLSVIKIWSEHKYGACYDEILREYHSRKYDLHILTGIDIPWDEDPQRENPHLREFFYDTFKNDLIQRGANFIEVSGSHYERQKKAVKAIDALLNS
ncbi:AAA family ATPase [Fulvivirga lutea]|uniref:ATP-binding protein n=1 Tax=Fulvivirga lutea TaxID=2810512 RepID=A0A975A1J3_9BACT|nr:ATP-binding protein [Fulvivirga lutea]QSE98376.1 ATP-binding protein [Fulvivirga lutea]